MRRALSGARFPFISSLPPSLPDERKVGFEAVELPFHLREQVPRSRSNSELVQFQLPLAMFCLPGREEL